VLFFKTLVYGVVAVCVLAQRQTWTNASSGSWREGKLAPPQRCDTVRWMCREKLAEFCSMPGGMRFRHGRLHGLKIGGENRNIEVRWKGLR